MNPSSVKIAAPFRPLSLGLSSTLVAFALVLSLSFYFRVASLGTLPGVNGDEAVVAVTIAEANAGKPVVLRMPTGRMFSPLYAVFSFVFNQTLPPSFVALRLPSLLGGFLLIFLTFWLGRKVFPLYPTCLATLLVSLSPVNTLYSRSGIEQSFTGVAGIVLAFAALQSSVGLLFLLLAMALVFHPTNIFYVPLLIPLLIYRVFSNSHLSPQKRKALLAGIVFSLFLGTLIFLSFIPSHFYQLFSFSAMASRLVDVQGLIFFSKHWINLVSGLAAIEQFVGPVPFLFKCFWNGVVFLFVLGVWGLGVPKLYHQKKFKELAFVLGTLLSNLAFYTVSGTYGIEPGVLRYALVLLNPFLMSLAILLAEFPLKPVYRYVGYFLVFTLLAIPAFFFFHALKTKNSETHFTYKTGMIEPKEVAFRRILSVNQGKPNRILVQDWWTYWPIRYLALSHPELRVDLFESPQGSQLLKETLEQGGIVVAPKGTSLEKILARSMGKRQILTSEVEGYGNQIILKIWVLQ